MPINGLKIQRRAVEIGRLRLGQQVKTQRGKMRPAKLDAFRFTTASKHAADAVAASLGGEVQPWQGAPVGQQWEVFTTARELEVVIPPGEQSVSQFMEMWSGGGCVRRCDGSTELLKRTPCLCPEDHLERQELAQLGQACKPTTRVSLILPSLPGLGIWRLDTHGWHAASELAGAAETLAAARGQGVFVPAFLRIDQRRTVSRGQTKDYPVPVLEIRQTLAELMALQGGQSSLAAALPRTDAAAAIGQGPAGQPATGQTPAVGQRPARIADGAGAPVDAADVARRAAGADAALLGRLGDFARHKGWMDEFVEVDGVHTSLTDVLLARDDALRAAARQPDPAPAAAPVAAEPEQPEQPASAAQEEDYVPPDPTVTDQPRTTPEGEPTGEKDWP